MDERLTVIGAQMKIRDLLREAGVENAEGEAKLLLREAMGMSSTEFVLSYRQYACSACVEQAFAWADRRSAGEPLQYILGRAGFMGLDIQVAPGVLIPRPETEGLCEMLLKEAKRRDAEGGRKGWPSRVLDLCTGSGCIAAWAASAFPKAQVFAADLSEEALAIARENCAAFESRPGQVTLLQGDLFGALENLPASSSNGDGPCTSGDRGVPLFDAILSNPPYIPSATVDGLLPEVRDHEPRLALDGGPEGMDLVRRILREAPDHLAPGGLLLMEIDDTQEDAVLASCRNSGRWASFEVLCDLTGRVRYLRAFAGQ